MNVATTQPIERNGSNGISVFLMDLCSSFNDIGTISKHSMAPMNNAIKPFVPVRINPHNAPNLISPPPNFVGKNNPVISNGRNVRISPSNADNVG